MAIAFVNGGNNGSASTVSTISVTYSPTQGNTVVVLLSINAGATGITVVDSNSAGLTLGPSQVAGTVEQAYYYTAGSGVTSFTASWTTAAQCNMVVLEYSGVGSVNAGLTGNVTTGSSATASGTVTTQDNNDWITGAIVSVNPVTVTAGNLRKSAVVGNLKTYGVDNTVATAGSVSLTGTLTSAGWIVLIIELRVPGSTGGGGTSNWLSKAVATGMNKHT